MNFLISPKYVQHLSLYLIAGDFQSDTTPHPENLDHSRFLPISPQFQHEQSSFSFLRALLRRRPIPATIRSASAALFDPTFSHWRTSTSPIRVGRGFWLPDSRTAGSLSAPTAADRARLWRIRARVPNAPPTLPQTPRAAPHRAFR